MLNLLVILIGFPVSASIPCHSSIVNTILIVLFWVISKPFQMICKTMF